MIKELSNHALEMISTKDGYPRYYKMAKPGTGIYAVYISEVARRLCITGDICFGANNNGIISDLGYEIPWFAGHLSEGYLCEKFLHREWQWEAAIEEIEWQIKEAMGDEESWWLENAAKLQEFIKSPDCRDYTPIGEEFYDFMIDLGDDGCELPGFDYPRGEAGWLCAVQQRFAELFKDIKND